MNWWLYVCGICLVVTSGMLVGLLRRCRRWHCLADNRLELLRHLIDISFLYRDRPQLFSRVFRSEIAARKLRNTGIVAMQRFSLASDAEQDELFLVGLLDAGFTRKEVCAIFDLKSVNCFYVKYHRVKKKLSRAGKITKKTTL